MEWAYPISGAAVGMIVGMTGVGGGALMTPILILLLDVAPAAAIGTDLWFAVITKAFGVTVHQRNESVDWEVFRRLCYGSLPAAILTSLYLYLTRTSSGQNGMMVAVLGGVLMVTSLAMLFKTSLHQIGRNWRLGKPERFKHVQPTLTVIAGLILGVLVTLTSIGAGALGATILLYLYPLRLTTVRLVGTDLAHAIPLALVAGVGHLALGNVDTSLLFMLLSGSIPGVIAGSLMSHRVPDSYLRVAIALILLSVGLKMLRLI